MPEVPSFPPDLKSLLKDCILSLFWPKAEIIKFLQQCGAQATDLSVVRAPSSELRRHEIVDDVFYRLGRRSDGGIPTFQQMAARLSEWSHFDRYWFEEKQKLDRPQAESNILALRQALAKRNEKTAHQKAAAAKVFEDIRREEGLKSLLHDFLQLAQGGITPQKRGYEFEKFLKRLFDHQNIEMSNKFRIVGEEIDGSFKYDGENYIVEAKWQDSSISTEALYKFAAKADGKMYGRGVFISVNAYSKEGLPALITGKHIKTILVDGEDLTMVLEGRVSLSQMLDVKIRAAQIRGDVYVDPMSEKSKV